MQDLVANGCQGVYDRACEYDRTLSVMTTRQVRQKGKVGKSLPDLLFDAANASEGGKDENSGNI